MTIAEQMLLAFDGEFVPFAVNVNAGAASESIKPFMGLAEQLGDLLAGLTDDTDGTPFGFSTENWGYDNAASGNHLVERYSALWDAVRASDVLAGACWTQLTDTYQEVNGLLRADRSPKAELALLYAATTGRTPDGTAPGRASGEPERGISDTFGDRGDRRRLDPASPSLHFGPRRTDDQPLSPHRSTSHE